MTHIETTGDSEPVPPDSRHPLEQVSNVVSPFFGPKGAESQVWIGGIWRNDELIIGDLPLQKNMIVHSKLLVYQRVSPNQQNQDDFWLYSHLWNSPVNII